MSYRHPVYHVSGRSRDVTLSEYATVHRVILVPFAAELAKELETGIGPKTWRIHLEPHSSGRPELRELVFEEVR